MLRGLRRSLRRMERPPFLPSEHHNYNFEDNVTYTRTFRRALTQRDTLLRKLDGTQPPVRQRRGIPYAVEEGEYHVWRSFDQLNAHPQRYEDLEFIMVGRLEFAPRDLRAAFGLPLPPQTLLLRSTGVYEFTDSSLDTFLLYDHDHRLEARAADGSLLEHHARFWASAEPHAFRLSTTTYAQRRRFMAWVRERVAAVREGRERSFEEVAEERFGRPERFEDFDAKYRPAERVPAVMRLSRASIEKKYPSRVDVADEAYDVPLAEVPNVLEDPEAIFEQLGKK